MDYNPVMFLQWASEVATQFISGVDMNESIAKVATEHELNPHQIQRIVEEANHQANLATRKISNDQCFSIKLASLDTILSKVINRNSCKENMPKFAMATPKISNDYFEDRDKGTWSSIFSKLGTPEGQDQRNRNDWIGALTKLSHIARQLEADCQSHRVALESTIDQQVDDIRQAVQDEMVLYRHSWADVNKFAHAAFPNNPNFISAVLKTITPALVKVGEPVATDILSNNLPPIEGDTPQIINGHHTLIRQLDTLSDTLNQRDKLFHEESELCSHAKTLENATKVIRGTEGIKDYLDQGLKRYAEKPAEKPETFIDDVNKLQKEGGLPLAALLLGLPPATLAAVAAGKGASTLYNNTLGPKGRVEHPLATAERLSKADPEKNIYT